MSDLLWRALIAVLCVVLIFALIPPLFRLFGIAVNSDLLMVLRICIGGIAALYVFSKKPVPPA